MPTTPNDVLALAAAELGTVESPANSNKTKYGRWYGLDGQPWCAMFISWVFASAGLPLPASTAKGFAYTPSGAAWFQSQGRWRTSGPARGDVVFFDFPNDGVNRISHVGVVESVRADGAIVTIEGNTSPGSGGSQRDGGGVYRRVRSTGIVGYGRPVYDFQEEDMPLQEAEYQEIAKRIGDEVQAKLLDIVATRVDQQVLPALDRLEKALAAGSGGTAPSADAVVDEIAERLANG